MKPSPNIKSCKKCLLHTGLPGVEIDSEGLCKYCRKNEPFVPIGEDKLKKIFNNAQKKNPQYDALVPLSGGKDSTYVLYLACKKYNLNVLTYTFDNGFISDFAKKNIETSTNNCSCDHIWVKPSQDLIDELYSITLKQSGEICGICGIGIERSMLKISEAYRIPLILMGHSPTESNSFTSENIYDQERLKAIFKQNPGISKNMVKRFLIYPNLNFISSFIYTKIGRFGRKINVLYYIDLPTDKEIGNILKKEIGWTEPENSEYTRHFDCLAEPFTNYIREKRFGVSRRLPQLCNMIRNNEISREKALEIIDKDATNKLPENLEQLKNRLHFNGKDLDNICHIPVNVYSKHYSKWNKVFAKTRNILKKSAH